MEYYNIKLKIKVYPILKVKNDETRGHLYVQFHIIYPVLNEKQKKKYSKIFLLMMMMMITISIKIMNISNLIILIFNEN